jgi:branched-chain amino acid transport system ATP-binding protein
MVLLNVENLTASYGVTQALFGVDLSVQKGGVTALLGRNGVGKSTTIKSICRMLPYRSGSVEFDQTDLTQLPTHEAIKLGIGLVPEGRRCFSNLNVEQNLMVAARSGSWNFDRVTELFPRLAERRLQIASTLSGGEQQMLAIGRAFKKLKSGENLSILVVDKSLKELTQVADHAVVLARGETVWSGAIRELSDDIKDRYLGV